MTQTCRPAKCIEAIRVAVLDPCTLAPAPGPLNGYAIGCIIEPTWGPEVTEGDESVIKDDCGNVCHRDDRCDQVGRHTLEFKIANPDPEFQALLSGNPLMVDGGGNSIGNRVLTNGCSPWLFVELFERTDDCDDDGDPIYFRHVFPAARLTWSANEREGVFRILKITGKTKDVLTASIGAGPFFDIPAAAILSPAGERTDYIWFEDDLLPEVACGAIEVNDPEITTVLFDCEEDVLTITGTDLDDVVTIGFDTDDALTADNFNISGVDLVHGGTTTITISDFSTYAGGATTIHNVHFYDADSNLMETYGPVVLDIELCPAAPGFTILNDPDDPSGNNEGMTQIIAHPDGGYLGVGTTDNGSDERHATIWRITDDGDLDATWGGGDGKVQIDLGDNDEYGYAIAVEADGDIYVLVKQDATDTIRLAKLDPAGALVGGWGLGAGHMIVAQTGVALTGNGTNVMQLQEAQGRVLVAWTGTPTASQIDGIATSVGSFTGDSLTFANIIRNFTTDGSPDDLIAVLGDLGGLYYIGTGDVSLAGAAVENVVAGDFAWTTGQFNSRGTGMVRASDGSLYVASYNAAFTDLVIAKFDNTGTLDPAFGVAGVATINDIQAGPTNLYEVVAGDLLLAAGSMNPPDEMFSAFVNDANGSPIGTYDGDGLSPIVMFPGITYASCLTMLVEEADGRFVLCGNSSDGVSSNGWFARFDITSGAIEAGTFGVGQL